VDPIDKLLAIEEIRQTKSRYFRFIDTKDRAGLASVFSRDAVLDHREAEMDELVVGNQAIADFITDVLIGVVTVHHGHMAEVELTSPTTAHAVFAMEDKLWWPEGGPVRAMHGYGHYHEDYVLEDGAWRISLNRLTRLRVDHVS
jgi:SnoaL-like domain